MSDNTKQIIRHLHAVMTMQDIAQKGDLLPTIRAVQAWQCKRLMTSHKKMYEQSKFKPAVEFFVNELYGPKDFSQRDKDIARVAPKMAKLLPETALQSLVSALHLNALSFELDFDIAKKLKDKDINRETYLEAYRACDNRNARQQQIYFIEVLGKDLAEVVKMRGISALLLLSRKPAKLAGVQALHEFIESGFKAFKKLGNVDDFILPIIHFEQGLMNQMFDHQQPNPLPEV
jgi:hypothetical protein